MPVVLVNKAVTSQKVIGNMGPECEDMSLSVAAPQKALKFCSKTCRSRGHGATACSSFFVQMDNLLQRGKKWQFDERTMLTRPTRRKANSNTGNKLSCDHESEKNSF
jgi:hypothetical protein